MTANVTLLVVIGVLVSTGVYLMLERSIVKMLLGMMLFGNGVNLLILTVGGSDGEPPIVGRSSVIHQAMADPLAQAMILTAIVITMGVAAFVLALAYRSFTLTTRDQVENDPEDVKVISRKDRSDAPDLDRSDDPVTGAPSLVGDAFDAKGNPISIDELRKLDDVIGDEDSDEGQDELEPEDAR